MIRNEYMINGDVIPHCPGMHALGRVLIKRALSKKGLRYITRDKKTFLEDFKDSLNQAKRMKMSARDWLPHMAEYIMTAETIWKNTNGNPLSSRQKTTLKFVIEKEFVVNVLI